MAAITAYALANESAKSPLLHLLGLGLIIGAAAFAIGGLVGFLFGLPRTLDVNTVDRETPTPSPARMSTNTNLEEISDWLTKILVGIGLVQLGAFVSRLSELGDSLAPGLGGGDGAAAFAIGLVVYCLIIGFILSYLWTRIVVSVRLREIQRLLQAETDLRVQDAQRMLQATSEVLLSPLPPPPPAAPPAPPGTDPAASPPARGAAQRPSPGSDEEGAG